MGIKPFVAFPSPSIISALHATVGTVSFQGVGDANFWQPAGSFGLPVFFRLRMSGDRVPCRLYVPSGSRYWSRTSERNAAAPRRDSYTPNVRRGLPLMPPSNL